jgi:hypothetical protein
VDVRPVVDPFPERRKEHTPLPWTQQDRLIQGTGREFYIASCYSAKDAALIVHCVNTHDRLLALLADVAAYLSEIDEDESHRLRSEIAALQRAEAR